MAVTYNGYSTKKIHRATGAEKYRCDVARHLSSKGAEGIENQLFELLDNTIDESVEFYRVLTEKKKFMIEYNGKEMPFSEVLKMNNEVLPPLVIYLTITSEWKVIIEDPGRGLPCDIPVDENGNPTGDPPGIFLIYEDDSAGSKKIHNKPSDDDEDDAYSVEDISGMHGAGATVSAACTETFKVITNTLSSNAKGEGAGCYSLSYTEGVRDKEDGNEGLLYLGPLTYDNPNPILKKYNIPKTGTRVEYKYDSKECFKAVDSRGFECEPYNKNSIIDRIKTSLIGIANRDSIIIKFNFQGEEIEITPNDYTPESILGVTEDNEDDLTVIQLKSPADAEPSEQFTARLYLMYTPNESSLSISTVVNRLPLRVTTSDAAIRNAINNVVMKDISSWHEKHPKILRPSTRNMSCADFFKAVLIMGMPSPEFSSQVKDELVSSDYLRYFTDQLEDILTAHKEILNPAIDRYKEYAKRYTQMKEDEERLEKERRDKAGQKANKKTAGQIMKEAKAKNRTLEGRVESANEDKNLFESIRDPAHSPLGFFEGRNALNDVQAAIEAGEMLNMYSIDGKLPNIYNPKLDINKSEKIQKLLRSVFSKDYPEYYIFTDPDPDGAHIRILLIALIAEFRPEMLSQEKVFIIRAPYGVVNVSDNDTIIIQNDFEGVRKLVPGANLVNSYSEMVSALAQGAVFVKAYAGVKSVISDCSAYGITVHELLHNPQYKIPIKAPKKEDLEYLREILTPASKIKKEFTDKYCTDRHRLSKYIKSANKNIKVKKGDGKVIDIVSQTVSDKPSIYDYASLTYYNL